MKTVMLLDADADLLHSVGKLYEESFPVYERRSWNTQMLAAQNPDSHCVLMLSDDDVFLALLFYWMYDNVVYVEYLAVNPNLRGQNIGSRIMEHLIENNSDKTIILEIDPPQDEISIRRLHFYERIGFTSNPYTYIHPSYTTGTAAHPHELSIMSYGKPIPNKTFDEFLTYMKEVVLKYID